MYCLSNCKKLYIFKAVLISTQSSATKKEPLQIVQEEEIDHVLRYMEQLDQKVQITDETLCNEVVKDNPNSSAPCLIPAQRLTPYEELSPVLVPSLPTSFTIQPHSLTFDMHLLEEEDFKALPKYMVGRITLDDINEFINFLNEAVGKKYEILAKRQTALKTHEIVLHRKYQKQQQTFKLKGKQQFITEEDIAKESGKATLEKKIYSYLTILRHTKKLMRSTVNGVVIYTIQK